MALFLAANVHQGEELVLGLAFILVEASTVLL